MLTIVSVDAPDNYVVEGGSWETVTFHRDNSNGTLPVSFSVSGSAYPYTDFNLHGAMDQGGGYQYQVEIPDGQYSVDVSIEGLADTESEFDEDVYFYVDDPMDGSYTPDWNYAYYGYYDYAYIQNDSLPTVSVDIYDDYIPEGGSWSMVQFYRDDSSGDLSVLFDAFGSASPNQDYIMHYANDVGGQYQIDFIDGDNYAYAYIEALADSEYESDEDFYLQIADPQDGSYTPDWNWQHGGYYDTAYIQNVNPAPTVSIMAVDNQVDESGDSSEYGQFQLYRDDASSDLYVSLSVGGNAEQYTDYALSSTYAYFNYGEHYAYIDVDAMLDYYDEGVETVELEIYDPGDGTYTVDSQAAMDTVYINDAGAHVSIATDVGQISEGDGLGTVLLYRVDTNGPLTVVVTTAGSATEDADYQRLPDDDEYEVHFADGEEYAYVDAFAHRDSEVESVEYIEFHLQEGDDYWTSGQNYDSSTETYFATVAIDDVPSNLNLIPTVFRDEDSAASTISLASHLIDPTAPTTYQVWQEDSSSQDAVSYSLDANTGDLTITPLQDSFGFLKLRVAAENTSTGQISETPLLIVVNAVNDPPVALSGGTKTVAGDGGEHYIDIRAAFSDLEDGSYLTYSNLTVSGGSFLEPPVIDGDFIKFSTNSNASESGIAISVTGSDGEFSAVANWTLDINGEDCCVDSSGFDIALISEGGNITINDDHDEGNREIVSRTIDGVAYQDLVEVLDLDADRGMADRIVENDEELHDASLTITAPEKVVGSLSWTIPDYMRVWWNVDGRWAEVFDVPNFTEYEPGVPIELKYEAVGEGDDVIFVQFQGGGEDEEDEDNVATVPADQTEGGVLGRLRPFVQPLFGENGRINEGSAGAGTANNLPFMVGVVGPAGWTPPGNMRVPWQVVRQRPNPVDPDDFVPTTARMLPTGTVTLNMTDVVNGNVRLFAIVNIPVSQDTVFEDDNQFNFAASSFQLNRVPHPRVAPRSANSITVNILNDDPDPDIYD